MLHLKLLNFCFSIGNVCLEFVDKSCLTQGSLKCEGFFLEWELSPSLAVGVSSVVQTIPLIVEDQTISSYSIFYLLVPYFISINVSSFSSFSRPFFIFFSGWSIISSSSHLLLLSFFLVASTGGMLSEFSIIWSNKVPLLTFWLGSFEAGALKVSASLAGLG